jgi:hypothetical protein
MPKSVLFETAVESPLNCYNSPGSLGPKVQYEPFTCRRIILRREKMFDKSWSLFEGLNRASLLVCSLRLPTIIEVFRANCSRGGKLSTCNRVDR